MFFTRLKIHNFVTIREADIELGQGSFFITGENRDEPASMSNGAGKSLLCQSIMWALFDDLLRKGMLKDDVIGTNDDYTQVVLTINKGGQEIIIDRVRNHPKRGNDVIVTIDGEDTSKHKGNNAYLERLLGISKNLVYYCSYSDASKEPFAGLSPAQLGKAISEILETDRFDRYSKELRAHIKSQDSELNSLQLKFSERNKLLTACENGIAFVQAQMDEFADKKNERLKGLRSELAAAENELGEYASLLSGREDTAKRLAELKDGIDDIERRSAQYERAAARIVALERRLSTLDKQAALCQADADRVTAAIDNLSGTHSGECQYCGNELKNSKKTKGLLANYVAELDEKKSELISLSVDRDAVKVELMDEQSAAAELKSQIEESKGLLTEHNKLARMMGAFEQVERSILTCQKQIQGIKNKIESATNEGPEALERELLDKTKEAATITQQLEEIVETIKQVEEGVDQAKTLEGVLRQIKLDVYNSFLAQMDASINANLHDVTDGDYSCRIEEGDQNLALTFSNASKAGNYLSYHCFSTGERARINKAVSAALNDIVGAGFIIDDEGLNGVDPAGVANVLEFMVRKNTGKSLFFVSHDYSVQEYFARGRNLHVIKEGGISRVETR